MMAVRGRRFQKFKTNNDDDSGAGGWQSGNDRTQGGALGTVQQR